MPSWVQEVPKRLQVGPKERPRRLKELPKGSSRPLREHHGHFAEIMFFPRKNMVFAGLGHSGGAVGVPLGALGAVLRA